MNIPERIAKIIARSGYCSRRDAERLIQSGKVTLNGEVVTSPTTLTNAEAEIVIEGRRLKQAPRPRLWLYYKPSGLVTTHRDEKGRPTVFDSLPRNMPRVISVGRLDLNSEGLLLLTNDGALARKLEHPSSGLNRVYRVRIQGRINAADITRLAGGITIDGFKYAPVIVESERKNTKDSSNMWVTITLTEGKNREIRKIMESLGYRVNRLIRQAYGIYTLGTLKPGEVIEVENPLFNGK